MQKMLLFVDKMSTWVGQTFSWLIVGLTLLISWEVFSRYVLEQSARLGVRRDDHDVRHAVHDGRAPTRCRRTATCAATCSTASSSRARRRASDLMLYIVFFIPGRRRAHLRGLHLRGRFLGDQRALEHHRRTARRSIRSRPSSRSPGAFLLVQGIVEIIRCVICIKQGEWPSREEDVEEVDVDKLKEMVHVKDEDIAKLDEFVVIRTGALQVRQGTLVRPVAHGLRSWCSRWC